MWSKKISVKIRRDFKRFTDSEVECPSLNKKQLQLV